MRSEAGGVGSFRPVAGVEPGDGPAGVEVLVAVFGFVREAVKQEVVASGTIYTAVDGHFIPGYSRWPPAPPPSGAGPSRAGCCSAAHEPVTHRGPSGAAG